MAREDPAEDPKLDLVEGAAVTCRPVTERARPRKLLLQNNMRAGLYARVREGMESGG